MAEPYDRLKEYFSPGEYILFTSKYGKSIWLAIIADEPMGQSYIQIANAAVSLAGRAARAGAGAVVPPGVAIDAEPVSIEYLEPQREDRMYQVIPTIFAIDRTTQELVPRAQIPPMLEIEYDYPTGDRQGGSDRGQDVTINGVINRPVGGFDRGRIPVNMIYTRSDPSPIWQLFIFYKTFPGFRLINSTRGIVGGGGGVQLDEDWYLAFIGRKYIFRTVTTEEERKLNNHELPYRSIPSPGGVPPSLLRRELNG